MPRGGKRTRSVTALEADNNRSKLVKVEDNDTQIQEAELEASGIGDKDARIRELEAQILELSQLAPSRHASVQGQYTSIPLQKIILIFLQW